MVLLWCWGSHSFKQDEGFPKIVSNVRGSVPFVAYGRCICNKGEKRHIDARAHTRTRTHALTNERRHAYTHTHARTHARTHAQIEREKERERERERETDFVRHSSP